MQRWRVRSRGDSGFGVLRQVLRRGDDGGALIRRDAHRDHVALDELAELEARVEALGDDVDAVVADADVHRDLGMRARERAELRRQHERGGHGRGHEADAAGRPVAQAGELVERFADVPEGGLQAREQGVAGLGRGDAARRPRQQPHAEPFLEPADRLAQRRR